VGLAALHTHASSAGAALGWLVLVQQHPAATFAARKAAEELLAKLEAHLTPEQVAAARAHALATSLEQLALSVTALPDG
jgi:hypothetical protein